MAASVASGQGQQIIVGSNGIQNLSDAMNQIQQNAGDVMIYLRTDVIQNNIVEIPSGLSGLNSVSVASYTGYPVTVAMGGNVFCANGVSFTLAKNVTFSNSYLMGGNCLAAVGNVEVPVSNITINGFADFVFGGGLAIGYGAKATVNTVNITVTGQANRVHGGGYAFNGGQTETSSVNLNLMSGSSVTGNVYAGGLADGQGSTSTVEYANVQTMGMAAYIDTQHGIGQNGGITLVGAQLAQPVPQIQPQLSVPQIDSGVPYGGQSLVINVGPGGSAANFSEAVNQISYNSGAVVFNVVGSFTQNAEVMIPQNKGITSLTVQTSYGVSTVTWPEDVGFYACGVPFTLGQSVTFNNGIIYGGCNAGAGDQSILNSANIVIAGTANKVIAGGKAKGTASMSRINNTNVYVTGTVNGWIYNGGSALYGGYSSVDGTALLRLQQGSRALQSVTGGGFAFGSASQSVVANSIVSVGGTVMYAVYAGGNADQAGMSSVSGSATIRVEASGNVGQSVRYGGRAYKNSRTYVAAVTSQIMGRVGATVHQEGRGTDGGVSTVGRIY